MRLTDRNLLTGNRDLAAVRHALAGFDPTAQRRYPSAADRDAWKNLPSESRQRLLADGEKRLTEKWEPLLASVLLDYPRHGNRETYQKPLFNRRSHLQELALAECVEGQGRFLDAVVDGIWLTCEETWWGFPAHLTEQKGGPDLPDISNPTVDLGVGETAALLAWIDHVLGEQLDGVSKLIRPRIRHEVDRQLLSPTLARDDFWWMSWHIGKHTINNWNPWVNSNWLACVLLLEADTDRRDRAVHKIMRSLDRFINHQPADGGCDEGPVYWGRAGASLFDCLELLHYASDGRISIFDQPVIKETGRYIMRAHIDGDWLVNFADASAKGDIDGHLVQRYGRHIQDDALVDFGRWVQQHQAQRPHSHIRSLNRTLAGLFDIDTAVATPPPPLLRDVWLPELQFMVARNSAGSSSGFYLAAKGGHNAESHNHNDIGSFIISLDGDPLLIDVGVETYTAKTFSPQRYEIWTMQSQWHNLPTINGVMQQNGRTFAAQHVSHTADDAAASLSLDIAAAYPAEAGIRRWTRTLRLERNGAIILTDDYELSEAREPLVWNFMAPMAPEIVTDGQVCLHTPAHGQAMLSFARGHYHAGIEQVDLGDPQLNKIWGDRIYRLQLTAQETTTAMRREFRFSIPSTKTK
jgi:hypothetical protein